MNKIYLIKLEDYDYDQYSGWVVIAKDEDEAKLFCKITKEQKDSYDNKFESNIKEIKVLGETTLNAEIILGDFHAG